MDLSKQIYFRIKIQRLKIVMLDMFYKADIVHENHKREILPFSLLENYYEKPFKLNVQVLIN